MARLIALKQTAPERFLARFDTGEALRSDTPDRDELRRASDYLYRRGFGRDEIRAAIARYQDNYEEY